TRRSRAAPCASWSRGVQGTPVCCPSPSALSRLRFAGRRALARSPNTRPPCRFLGQRRPSAYAEGQSTRLREEFMRHFLLTSLLFSALVATGCADDGSSLFVVGVAGLTDDCLVEPGNLIL